MKLFSFLLTLSNRVASTTAPTVRSVDVAIVGSGFAGLAAAIEAANTCHGRVVVIEKMPTPGGNSVMNAGQVAVVGNKRQLAAGIEDNVQLMTHDMLKAGVDLNHPNLLHKLISTSNELVEWTEKEIGIQYRDRVTQLGGHSMPRTLSTLNASGRDIIDPMLKKIKTMPNVELLLDSSFRDLVMSNDGKGIEGITVVQDDGEIDFLCSRGVVLATGGFSTDVKFRAIQNPAFGENIMTTNQPGATAEVLKAALKIGAMSVQLSRIQLGPWTSPDEEGFGKAPFFCLGAGFPYGIIVDPHTCKSFVNELPDRYTRSMAILKDVGHPVICLTDAVGAQHSLEKCLTKCEPAVKSYSTIADLAEAYGMKPTTLQITVDEYNAGVQQGKDTFGKTLRGDLLPMTKPPFYATRLWPKVHHTCGGVHIDEEARVMHIDGHPIGGLFGAGEFTGGVHGGDRLGSCATLDCLSFGRIAGRNAAIRETAKTREVLDLMA